MSRSVTLTEAFALVCGAVDVHLGADDASERHKHLSQFHVAKLLRQMIDEQIATLGTCAWKRRKVGFIVWQFTQVVYSQVTFSSE